MWMLAGVWIKHIVHLFLEQELCMCFSFIQGLSLRLLSTVFRFIYSGVEYLYWFISLWWPMVYSASCVIYYSVEFYSVV